MGQTRQRFIQLAFVLVAVVYVAKLFYLQIVDTSYRELAASNSLQRVVDYPYRGVIYDRHGRILVYNVPVYDVMVVPREMSRDLDTARLCRIVGIPLEQGRLALRKARMHSRVKPSPFVKQLSQADFARLQERLTDFAGFYVNPRTVRAYPHTSSANVLGYIGEISQPKLEAKRAEGDRFYKSGDYIGISGLEATYEEVLRGRRGVKYMLVDVHGVQKGSFKEGALDTSSVRGENLYTGLDLDLQLLGDTLMRGKTGSIVAIEPRTGEILCMVSGPSYDPNLLTGREFSANYATLARDISKPLFNRASQAMYRPGSTFKIVNALAAMQEGVLGPQTSIPCHSSPMNCHPHPSPQYLMGGVIYSCNSYFYHVFKRTINRGYSPSPFIDSRLGLAKWNDHVATFGFGQKLGVDISNERSGRVPTVPYYDKVYGERRWKFSTIYSISIGEGEYSVNPIQMANLAAAIANRGWWITPHFVKTVGEQGQVPAQNVVKHQTSVAPEHFDYIAQTMEQVVIAGKTVWGKSRIDSVTLCGKTGTSQNAKGKDHSIFICFAPKDNPRIAVACFVENAGFGGYAAAPIASLIVERFLKNRVVRKNLKQFMADKEYPTVIQKQARERTAIRDSLRRDSVRRGRSIRVVPVSAPGGGPAAGDTARRRSAASSALEPSSATPGRG